jgi:uncharacterized protein YdaU (DUF1376 family)
MSARPPAFLFYPRDFLADARVELLTLEQTGAYMRLLCYAWLERGLAADPIVLARLVHVAPSEFDARIWPAIAPCFEIVDGRLVQPRLERTRQAQQTASAQATAAAFRRWNRRR